MKRLSPNHLEEELEKFIILLFVMDYEFDEVMKVFRSNLSFDDI